MGFCEEKPCGLQRGEIEGFGEGKACGLWRGWREGGEDEKQLQQVDGQGRSNEDPSAADSSQSGLEKVD